MSSLGEMFRMFTEKDLSTDMINMITDPMRNMVMEQKEERASQINIIANTCKTESELQQKLQEENLV